MCSRKGSTGNVYGGVVEYVGGGEGTENIDIDIVVGGADAEDVPSSIIEKN
jgi:hypothetical protein